MISGVEGGVVRGVVKGVVRCFLGRGFRARLEAWLK